LLLINHNLIANYVVEVLTIVRYEIKKLLAIKGLGFKCFTFLGWWMKRTMITTIIILKECKYQVLRTFWRMLKRPFTFASCNIKCYHDAFEVNLESKHKIPLWIFKKYLHLSFVSYTSIISHAQFNKQNYSQ
jgi:hypothetical protein